MKNSVDSGKIGLLHCEDTISRENRLVSRTETGCEYHFYTLGSTPCFSKVDILRRCSRIIQFSRYSSFSKTHLHTLHILSFLVKRTVNIAVQRDLYRTMPQKFTQSLDIET